MMRRRVLALMLAVVAGVPAAWAQNARETREAALWRALATPGHFALIRHATAPGIGDPDGFKLEDCATQRNLSDAGRAEAKRLGEAFRTNGITSARVLSSQWCRCLETARLMDLGPVEPIGLLNSFFGQSSRGPMQTAALKAALGAMSLAKPVVLVTHQVVITALVGGGAASAETVVVRRDQNGQLSVVGTLDPPR